MNPEIVPCCLDPRDFLEISAGIGVVYLSAEQEYDGFVQTVDIALRSEEIEKIKAALDAAWIVALANERGE
jgi:hypothetical protein